MEFNINQSVDKTGHFLDSLIIRKSLKLVDDISNLFNYQYEHFFMTRLNAHNLNKLIFQIDENLK